MTIRRISVVVLSLLLAAAPTSLFAWMVNKDVEQTFATPQSNFETVLQGNVTQGLFGGVTSVTNPFSNPTRGQSFDGTNTTIVWAGTNSIAQSAGTKRHFGIFGRGQNPPSVLAEFWTPAGSGIAGRVPGLGAIVTYPATSGTATGVIRNDSADEITVGQLGWAKVGRDVQLGNLNASGMPPGTFNVITLADPILSPGEVTPSFNITTVTTSSDAIVIFVQSQFSGASATSNAYSTNVVREWVASNDAVGVPGVSPLGIVLLALLLGSIGLWYLMRMRRSQGARSA